MKFIKSFFISTLVTCFIYYAAVLLLIDAPIPAEYWVAELITIKKKLVKDYAGKKKIVVAGGSSALFGIDAEQATKSLGMPVLNFGLHAGLRLEKILQEVAHVLERGDFLVLALEPPYYDCNGKLNAWIVRNIIGWGHDDWKKMSYLERREFVSLVSPAILVQMFKSEMLRKLQSPTVSKRLDTLDNALVLSKFSVRTMPPSFEYSAYNINNHGDMQQTKGARFTGKGWSFSSPSQICDKTESYLIGFIENMKKIGVKVYFANTPYIDSATDLGNLRKGESSFHKDLAHVGCIIDKREDLVLDRRYFFNSNMHLNVEGRSIRTDLFVRAVREKVLSGVCGS